MPGSGCTDVVWFRTTPTNNFSFDLYIKVKHYQIKLLFLIKLYEPIK